MVFTGSVASGAAAVRRGRCSRRGYRPSAASASEALFASLSVSGVAGAAWRAAAALVAAQPGRSLRATVDQCDPFPAGVAALGLARFNAFVAESWPPPADFAPCAALHDLLKSDDTYHLERRLALEPYDETKLQLVKCPMRPKEVSTVVSEEFSKFILDPDRWIVEPDHEIVKQSDSGVPLRPYWDPVLKHSARKRLLFLRQLHTAGLLTWRRRSRTGVGCFFVGKKEWHASPCH